MKGRVFNSTFLHQGTHKALRHRSHSFTCKQTPCLSFLRGVHQMSPPQQLRQQTSNCSALLIYRPRKDERLSWPTWLTYSGWLTHISGHPSATSRAQDSESTSAKDQCSTAGPRKLPGHETVVPSMFLSPRVVTDLQSHSSLRRFAALFIFAARAIDRARRRCDSGWRSMAFHCSHFDG